MRKKIILHVGHGKTGSSAIQSMLARNVGRLAELGIDYPEHPDFVLAQMGKISSGNIAAAEGWVDQVRSAAERSDAPKVLFSNERLFWQIPARIDDLLDLARDHDLVYAAFLRDPVNLVFSRYGQDVKRGGETSTLDAWLARDRTLLDVVEVLRTVQRHDLALKLRNYSRVSDQILPVFCEMIGLSPEHLALDLPHQTVNRSLTRSELHLQLAFNRHFGKASSAFVSDVLVNSCPDIPAETYSLSPSAYDAFVERNRTYLDEINQVLAPTDHLVIDAYDPEWATFDETHLVFQNRQVDALSSAISARLTALQSAVEAKDAERQQAETKLDQTQQELEQAHRRGSQLETELARIDAELAQTREDLRSQRLHPWKGVFDWIRYHAARAATPLARLVSERSERRLVSSAAKRDPRRP